MRLKAELLKKNGGKPIRSSPEEHQRLNELRKKIDPDDVVSGSNRCGDGANDTELLTSG